ncbi:MAG TPA: hypothetical protein DCQ36_08730 [Actinobacteria bacterium]|jgi:hypothetical protein|nr:hypothetical protein [Actinomycetota bacterium]
MEASERHRRLSEVVECGDPAQQAQARLLLEALAARPDDAAALEAAALLVDAYLNDPYLTR